MAIGTTQGRRLTAFSVVKEALQRARIISGVEDPEGSDVTMGMGLLTTNLQEWQAADMMIRNIERTTVTLTASQASYTSANGVPSDIIEIQFPVNLTRTDGKDQQVFQMTHAEYNEISDKAFTAIPSQLLVEHLSSGTKITLWPKPNAVCTSLSFWRHRFMYDALVGNELDMRHMYQKAAILQLAGDFADHYKQPEALINRLYGEFKELYERVKIGSGDNNDIQFTVPW